MFSSKHLDVLLHLIIIATLSGGHYYFHHFINKEIEAQRSEFTFLKPHSQKVVELELEFNRSRVYGFNHCPIHCLHIVSAE